MGTNYRPYEPDQPFLFPPSPRDWLPRDHLAYFISDTLDQLDLSALHQPYEGDGRRNQPYHPTMLVKVLVYAYATGVFSSRRIASKLIDDVALRLLAAGNQPDFRTINRFRQQHLETFGKLFVELVQLAQKMGLVKLGTVALDGTKIKANASKHKAMSYQRMKEEEQQLEKEIQQLLEKAHQTDAAEDELYGPGKSGDELPPELHKREQRLEKIREAKQALEDEQAEKDKQQGRHPGDGKVASETRPQGGCSKFKREFGEPKPQAQRNFSDPESRIMKSKQSFQQCYNAQAVVEEGRQLIVARQVGQNAADNGSLIEMVDQVEQNTGSKPECLLADAGYRSEKNFLAMEERKIEGIVALAAGKQGGPGRKEAKQQGHRSGERAHGEAPRAAARQATIRAPQRDGGASVRMGERGVRIPAIFAAGSQESTRRMELGNDGVEPAADGEDGGAPDGGLSGAKREKSRPRKPLSSHRGDAVAATKDRIRIAAAHSRCRPQKSNLAPVLPSCRISVGQTPRRLSAHQQVAFHITPERRVRESTAKRRGYS